MKNFNRYIKIILTSILMALVLASLTSAAPVYQHRPAICEELVSVRIDKVAIDDRGFYKEEEKEKAA